MYQRLFLLLILFLYPLSTQASVIINEIAWMGGPESANHEWIELYNSGSEAVVLDGWTLSDGANLSINLSGSVPGSSYAVLERSSEESSPVTALLIYTGALVNTGVTLTLKNASGQIMDQVAGGENWQEVGGDNTNKDTAQYTSQGWVTDTPTPKAQNRSGRVELIIPTDNDVEVKSDSKPTSVTIKTKDDKKVKSVSLVTPNTILKLSTEMQDVTYVNQTIPFSVTGSGIGENIINSLVYTWNFGDSYTATGTKVTHAYSYPGTYVVTINAKYARYDETIRREITVLPVTFSLTENDYGDIQIQNDSPYDVDISGFVLRGEKTVTLPPRTIILPKATITIAKNRLGLRGVEEKFIVLYDTKGKSVTTNFAKIAENFISNDEGEELVTETVISKPLISQIETSNNVIEDTNLVSSLVFDFTDLALAGEEIIQTDSEIKVGEISTETPKDNQSESRERWPYAIFFTLIILSLFGIYLSRR